MRNLLVVALALCVSGLARADATSLKARDLAKLVLSEQTWNKLQEATAQAVAVQMAQDAQRRGKTLPADFSARFRGELNKLIPYSEIIDLQTGLLVKYYSAKELDQLTAFYRSPLGQKTIQVMPEIQRDVQGIVMQKLSGEMPQMLRRLESESPAAEPASDEPQAQPG